MTPWPSSSGPSQSWKRAACRSSARSPSTSVALPCWNAVATMLLHPRGILFMTPDCAVVLTGSQRPLGEIRSDARLNLIDAVTSAAARPTDATSSSVP